MSIYIRNGEQVSKQDFYHSEYNDIFIAVYDAKPSNLHKALEEIKAKGCSLVEAYLVLGFVLDLSLVDASMIIQKIWYKTN